jgi:hypothetical protein
MRSIFDSEGGWTGILVRFAAAAEGRELKSEVPCSAEPGASLRSSRPPVAG